MARRVTGTTCSTPPVHSSGREETLFTPHRYDILDPALTRPGRFDRLVRIELPDEAGA